MIVGVTGTEEGGTLQQLTSARIVLVTLRAIGAQQLDMGECIGVDAELNAMARELGYRTAGHPPDNDRKRAVCKVDERHAPLPYLKRNRVITEVSSVLLALPEGYGELFRGSGTWATVRYMEKLCKPVLFIWPDGLVSSERRP